jgi:hypothetical protein
MPKENCLIVRAAGKRLDLLRGEAARIPTERRSAPGSALKILSQKSYSHSPATASASPVRTADPLKNPPAWEPVEFGPTMSRCSMKVRQL